MAESGASGFCVNCGASMVAGAKFCAECGTERAVAPSAPFGASPHDELPPPPAPPSPPSAEATEDDVPLPPPPPSAKPEDTTEEVPLPPPPPVPPSSPPAADDEKAVAGALLPPPPRRPVAPPPPPPTTAGAVVSAKTRSPNRNRAIVTGLIVGLVIVAFGGGVYAVTRSDDSSPSTAADTSAAPPVTAAPATQPSATTPPTSAALGERAVVTQIDGILATSAGQVTTLRNIIGQFDPTTSGIQSGPCELSGDSAAAQTQPIIDGRKAAVSSLNTLGASATGEGAHMVSLLKAAINLSLQSDYSYQSWMTTNASTDSTSPCARAHNSDWDSFQAVAPQAGAAKQAFLAAYLPVAAQYGVRSNWKSGDF